MSNAAKDGFENEDVLASIRRLVAEESARGEARETPVSQDNIPRAHAPEIGVEAPRPARVFQRRRSVDSAGLVDRQSINRAARAKLLLTDDFRVAEMKLQAEAQTDDTAERMALSDDLDDFPTELAMDLDALPATLAEEDDTPDTNQTLRRSGRVRAGFNDEEQTQLSKEIDGFLETIEEKESHASEMLEPSVEASSPIDLDALLDGGEEGIAIEDIPDEVLPGAEARAKRRRAAAVRAAQVSQASAAMRTNPAPIAAEQDTPRKDLPELSQADGAAESSVTMEQIEKAVQASLEAYVREIELAAPRVTEIDINPEMLRDMVSDIVRRELQGSLGERITRNVRKLVRREIYRALEARDLG